MDLVWLQALGIGMASTFALPLGGVFAQIIPDATLSNNSQVRLQDNIRFIEGGTQAGGNLFHSFQEFSVPNNSTAYFNNSVDIQNIINRVTGGSISNIEGLIKANNSANLFLINPSGIIFGKDASLDIGGSFIASSASNIKFADGNEFNAVKPQEKSLLTISTPLGLGMGSNPGDIKVFGQGSGIAYSEITKDFRTPIESNVLRLSVKTGKTLALVGGNVSIEGGVLQSSAGRIEIGSVGANTQVNLVPVTEGWKLGYETVNSFADINMSGQVFVNTTGVGGGYISLFGRNINLTKESIIIADTRGNTNGGDITIVGDSITLNQADASNNTFGAGNAGKIKVSARSSITFENFGGVGNHTASKGNAGEINLEADSIIIKNRSGAGSNTYKDATGQAGIINIKGNYLLIEGNAGFGTRSFGRGDGGFINLEMGDIIVRNSSGMGSDASGSGNGGEVKITANSFLMENKSGFSNRTLRGGGRGGDFNINVKGSFILRNRSGIRTNTFGSGNAGQLNLTANYLEISDTSGLEVESQGSGRAGTLNIVADTMLVINNGEISAKTISGNGGNLTFNIEKLLQLNNNSQISSTAGTEQSGGNGGNIYINIPRGFIVAFPNENIDITANAFRGNGGQVLINASNILGIQPRSREYLELQRQFDPSKLPTNDITAISQDNPTLSGTVSINTPDVDPSRGVAELPGYVVNAANLIDQNFCARAYDSSFTITGRSGMAPSPYDILEDYTTWEDWRVNPSRRAGGGDVKKEEISAASSIPSPIIEAQGWVVNGKGQVELVALASNVTPHSLQNIPIECRR